MGPFHILFFAETSLDLVFGADLCPLGHFFSASEPKKLKIVNIAKLMNVSRIWLVFSLGIYLGRSWAGLYTLFLAETSLEIPLA